MDHETRHDAPPGAGDADLVAAIARRDETALAEAFRRHGQAVVGLARRLLGDATLAEDLAQDVFVGLWNAPERFDPQRGKLRTLLLTQTHGKAVDVIRSRNARQRREERASAEMSGAVPDVDAELMALTTAELVRAALAAIPSSERVAIELAYFGANTYRQVAEILGLPEGTVKTRIRSGLRRLHAVLAEVDADAHPDADAGRVGSGSGTTAGASPAQPTAGERHPSDPHWGRS